MLYFLEIIEFQWLIYLINEHKILMADSSQLQKDQRATKAVSCLYRRCRCYRMGCHIVYLSLYKTFLSLTDSLLAPDGSAA